jgi:hypothetical protein
VRSPGPAPEYWTVHNILTVVDIADIFILINVDMKTVEVIVNHMSLDLVKVIQDEQLERARRVRFRSAARRNRQNARERFSIRDTLGLRANAEPACVSCPVPSG